MLKDCDMHEKQLESIKEAYGDYGLPAYMWGALERYLVHGIMPGGFLTAVLENDLVNSLGKADRVNQCMLKEWVGFVYMYVPAQAWGSKECVEEWSEMKRNQSS
jgi:hypothetical protein